MRRVIISGATGFIGKAVTRLLSERGIEVLALSRHGIEQKPDSTPFVRYIDFDLFKPELLCNSIPKADYDVFYHFAWAGASGSERADVVLQMTNAKQTVDCLRIAAKLGCKRFVCAGTIMEHETIAATYARGNRPGMAYIYGAGKLTAHVLSMPVAADLGIDLLWASITNAYGPGEMSPRLINSTLRKCLIGETLQFTAATQNYDFVYIDDVARAFCAIGEQGKSFSEYLIGSSRPRPLKEFLLEIQKTVAPDLEFSFGDIPFTGIDMALSTFDSSATELDTGFRATVSFAEGIRRTFEWIKEQERLHG
jgi:nucleoside-diphosphate-sugar epimerase